MLKTYFDDSKRTKGISYKQAMILIQTPLADQCGRGGGGGGGTRYVRLFEGLACLFVITKYRFNNMHLI